MSDTQSKPEISLHTPTAEDGAAVHHLIANCPPLDTNSMYCNLLQASHFAQTGVVAKIGDEVSGFVSGYRIPGREHVLFVWQVAVGEKARGQGLATRMVKAILSRPGNENITHIETTITPDNKASWALFEGLSKKIDTELERDVMFDREKHFNNEHETELLARLGPFDASRIS